MRGDDTFVECRNKSAYRLALDLQSREGPFLFQTLLHLSLLIVINMIPARVLSLFLTH